MGPLAIRVRRINGERAIKRREKLVQQQKNKCHWCKKEMTPVKVAGDGNVRETSVTIDHIIRIADGGTNIFSNTVAACYACNQARNKIAMRNEIIFTKN